MAEMKLTAAWQGDFKGQGKISGDGWDVTIGIPADLGGSGAGADPKQLYTASTLACFTATLRAITANKKIPVETLAVETSAVATDEAFSIEHTALLQLKQAASDADIKAAQRAVETADKICAVGNLARKAGVSIHAKANISIAP
ncbi:OsmC family protein [Martelella sp. HB161492]|uniref:OsmC family protein n=1 Tax=Martelella sp. HB161492 TaxID=2720726 RepID=UPI001591130D|nr:OsmC family protein [Martelella sp. HB161492]